MYYLMYTMLINNKWKYIGPLFTSLVFSVFILLSIFLVHACENYPIVRSTSFDFFLASELLFLHGIRSLLHLEFILQRGSLTARCSAFCYRFYSSSHHFIRFFYQVCILIAFDLQGVYDCISQW